MNGWIEFHPKAAKEWSKLDGDIRRKLSKLLLAKNRESASHTCLRPPLQNFYKIKLRDSGYRAVYMLSNQDKILIISIGRRDQVYGSLESRTNPGFESRP